ncbi:HD-GYP domain-containing protein [Helicovermis profundi]|uniref:HD-GYP domain-containing protein n=1 Tax=Helicovermis profundi TaxID=3065157 RepID=A0AAU9EPG6_9FIRM|nr:hypothetical protein HLPR_23600 [Clostridia bacterium S502]
MNQKMELKTSECEEKYEKLIYERYKVIINSFIHTDNMDKRDFLKLVFDSAFELIPEAQKGSLYELNKDFYTPIFSRGYDIEVLNKLKFPKDKLFIDYDSCFEKTLLAKEVYIAKREDSKFDLETINIFKQLGTYKEFVSLYATIIVEGEYIGLISLENFDEKSFSKSSKVVLKFYSQLISNFYSQKIIQEREKKMYQNTIDALISAIEIKDKYTVGHARRVNKLSLSLAKEIGITGKQLNDIDISSILHDVGKIGIPTDILVKPEKLSKEEYEIVKQHPLNAKKILSNIEDFDRIAELTYMHHEHYDGNGYPNGLKGDQIPIEAQIIQIADAFDAMTSDRSYRKGFSNKDALKIVISEKGKQFNPKLVEILLKLIKN